MTAGHQALFAGGWVRDFLQGHPSSDIDIATTATPEEVIALFERTVPVGQAFGVVIVVEEEHTFEVASFRKEGRYLDGRKPESVEPATPEEDAERRDFTINGMFYNPLTEEIHDFVGGQEDLRNGVVRAIGDAHERFSEDRLRMIRAIRFAARFGFNLDPRTELAIRDHASTLYPPVSVERVWQELTRMSQSPRFDWALTSMHRLGLLQEIFPILRGDSEEEIARRTSGIVRVPVGTEAVLTLMLLFPKATVHEVNAIFEGLRVSTRERTLALFYHEVITLEKEAEVDLVRWTHVYANRHSDAVLHAVAASLPVDEMMVFQNHHRDRRSRLTPHIQRVQEKTPLVTAARLKMEGVRPGKKMGLLLRRAEELAIVGDLHQADEVMDRLKETEEWVKRND